MINIIFRITVFLVLIFNNSFSQNSNWKKDLIEMNKTYYSAKSFKMNVNVFSYAKSTDSKPTTTYNGMVAYNGSDYCSKMVGRLTIKNKRCLLVVDNPQKMILYRKVVTNETVEKSIFSITKLDSAMIFMEKNVQVDYIVDSDSEKRIKIKYKTGDVSHLEISINPKDYSLREMIYYYRDGSKNSEMAQKVVITYTQIELNKLIPENFFSESQYIVIKNKKVIATKAYQKYQLVNQSETNNLQ